MSRLSLLAVSRRAVIIGFVALLIGAGPASATWSVVAVDDETGEVGAAMASCVPGEVLGRLDQPLVPIVLVPGVAAAAVQGQVNLDAPSRISELVAAGADSAEIVADLTDAEFDELAPVRQYGVVRRPDSATSFTGNETSDAALDHQGSQLAVQGNLLRSDAVVDETVAAFERSRAEGDSLADALVDALLAGSTAGGDRRCDDQTALFAQVVVAVPTDGATEPSTLLTVTVDEGDGQNPVELLANAYDEGRSGVIEAGLGTNEGGPWFSILALGAAVVMVAGGGLALFRGMGSIRARR